MININLNKFRSKGGKKMEFLANLLSKVAEEGSATPYTMFWIFEEPECPEELI